MSTHFELFGFLPSPNFQVTAAGEGSLRVDAPSLLIGVSLADDVGPSLKGGRRRTGWDLDLFLLALDREASGRPARRTFLTGLPLAAERAFDDLRLALRAGFAAKGRFFLVRPWEAAPFLLRGERALCREDGMVRPRPAVAWRRSLFTFLRSAGVSASSSVVTPLSSATRTSSVAVVISALRMALVRWLSTVLSALPRT